ncbi:MAG: signal peptide peptidase SppA [Chloroflexi bacterium]|nr:signal peptide peptidase SppA [Chloroflexota bacterium]
MDGPNPTHNPAKPTGTAARSGLWARAGVVVGFALPVFACAGMAAFFFLSTASLAAQSPVSSSGFEHISGPFSGPAVAILDLSGTIVSGESGPFDTSVVAASGELLPLIHQAAADAAVRAILLRVNSPGGSVVPSDEIYHALKESGKPVVVLMGDLAASGAYYISMAADYIVANPHTLTGSIGVISEFPDAHGLLEKLGVQFTVIKSGAAKDIGSPYRPMTEAEQALWQTIVNETYEGFLKIVAEGRGLPVEDVRAIADGRVFTGSQALQLKLVDALGYEQEALAKAAELGKIEGEPRVIRLHTRQSVWGLLSSRMSGVTLPADLIRQALGPSLEYRWVP